MKGLELAKNYYNACKQTLTEQFPDVMNLVAVGLAGSGSECCGFDDDLSKDHDFEPSFCIFLPDEDVIDSKTAFQLERAYAKLPKEFMGFKRSPIDPVGGSRHGVIRIKDFFSFKTGTSDGKLSLEQWFSIPEYSLLEATNGEIFSDPSGEFSAIREKLKYFPEEVRLKKLAGYILLMGQSGQYNYNRCISRGETGAAQLAVFEFVQSALHCIYLINRAYMPYYKWCFKGLRRLNFLSHLEADLEFLISSGNAKEEAELKSQKIEEICSLVAEELREQKLININGQEMEQLAYNLNDKIPNPSIRNAHILFGV